MVKKTNMIYIPLYIKVLKFLKENPNTHLYAIAKQMNSTPAYMYKLKKELVKRKLITCERLPESRTISKIEFTEEGMFLAELSVELIKRIESNNEEIEVKEK